MPLVAQPVRCPTSFYEIILNAAKVKKESAYNEFEQVRQVAEPRIKELQEEYDRWSDQGRDTQGITQEIERIQNNLDRYKRKMESTSFELTIAELNVEIKKLKMKANEFVEKSVRGEKISDEEFRVWTEDLREDRSESKISKLIAEKKEFEIQLREYRNYD